MPTKNVQLVRELCYYLGCVKRKKLTSEVALQSCLTTPKSSLCSALEEEWDHPSNNQCIAFMHDDIIQAKITTKPQFENANFRFYHELIPNAAMM